MLDLDKGKQARLLTEHLIGQRTLPSTEHELQTQLERKAAREIKRQQVATKAATNRIGKDQDIAHHEAALTAHLANKRWQQPGRREQQMKRRLHHEWQHPQQHSVRGTQYTCMTRQYIVNHTPSGINGSTHAAMAAGRRAMGRMDQRTPRKKARGSGIHHDRTTTKH